MNHVDRDGCFVSYDEPHADSNYAQAIQMLQIPLKRVHGVRGMRRAYGLAASTVDTEEFFLVDADLFMTHPIDTHAIPVLAPSTSMLVWRTTNPLTGAVYGYGGLKLLRKRSFDLPSDSVDVTAGIPGAPTFRKDTVGESRFNSSPFHAWKAGLREAFKLSQACEYCRRSHDNDLLLPWLTVGRSQGDYANYAQLGVDAGIRLRQLADGGSFDARIVQDGQELKKMFSDIEGNRSGQ